MTEKYIVVFHGFGFLRSAQKFSKLQLGSKANVLQDDALRRLRVKFDAFVGSVISQHKATGLGLLTHLTFPIEMNGGGASSFSPVYLHGLCCSSRRKLARTCRTLRVLSLQDQNWMNCILDKYIIAVMTVKQVAYQVEKSGSWIMN